MLQPSQQARITKSKNPTNLDMVKDPDDSTRYMGKKEGAVLKPGIS